MECEQCGKAMYIPDGYEPTRYCCGCANDLLESKMTKVTVNGTTVEVPDGSNVSVINNQIFINDGHVTASPGNLKIEVVGGLINLTTDRSVEVTGSVAGSIDAGGSITCGDVGGNVVAGGSVNCGNVKGDVDAGGSVNCKGKR